MITGTQKTEWIEKAKGVVYSLWQRNLTVQSTGPTNAFGQVYGSHHGSETSVNYDLNKIEQAGLAWDKLIDETNPFSVKLVTEYPSTEATRGIRTLDLFPAFLDIDYSAIEYCIEKGVLAELGVCCRSAVEAFSHISRLGIYIAEDYEIENYQKVRFDLAVSGDVESILKQESEFRRRIVARMPPDKRAHFVLTLRIV